MAELADALDSGSSARKGVEVRVLLSAPIHLHMISMLQERRSLQFFYYIQRDLHLEISAYTSAIKSDRVVSLSLFIGYIRKSLNHLFYLKLSLSRQINKMIVNLNKRPEEIVIIN